MYTYTHLLYIIIIILNSARGDECIDFTMMCFFIYEYKQEKIYHIGNWLKMLNSFTKAICFYPKSCIISFVKVQATKIIRSLTKLLLP